MKRGLGLLREGKNVSKEQTLRQALQAEKESSHLMWC